MNSIKRFFDSELFFLYWFSDYSTDSCLIDDLRKKTTIQRESGMNEGMKFFHFVFELYL